MYTVLQVVAVALVSVAMALSLAHALEFPGKMRLDKETYYGMQSIYYPGFTIGGGVGEGGGTIATVILLFLTPSGSGQFWLTLSALLCLLAVQAVYWIFTHPVNNFWVAGEKLDRFSSSFFSFGTKRSRKGAGQRDWTQLRDRWEYSHVARAALSATSFVLLLVATASGAA